MSNTNWLDSILERSHKQKQTAERAIEQITDDELRRRPATGFNSVATVMRHVGGNLVSRWTDFLTTDGEKPTRNRESEFADWPGTRAELLEHWNRGWNAYFNALEQLTDEDLSKTVFIRTQPHTVPQAIIRTVDHMAYHVGQIVYLSRLMHSGDWQWLSIAPGESDAFNRKLGSSNSKSP